MRRLDVLKHEARLATALRGHKIGNFRQLNDHPTMYNADCKQCNMGVMVDTKPPPNGCQIVGRAVAVTCKESAYV